MGIDVKRLAGVLTGLSPDLPQWRVISSIALEGMEEEVLLRPGFGVTSQFEAVKFVRKRVVELEGALEEARLFLNGLSVHADGDSEAVKGSPLD